ncbi:hypothetical protein C4K40_4158 [Pseudomonas sp. CMR5c]|nr:hypothetical protein C4K40_4158 [Pseudomonas sp. CMR5c]
MGLTLADIPEEEVEIWPDLWPAFLLFEAMNTQWRVGPGGASGLDYAAIPPTALMLGIKRRDLKKIFPDLRVMEAEALAAAAESME